MLGCGLIKLIVEYVSEILLIVLFLNEIYLWNFNYLNNLFCFIVLL